jgi:hypothetical protein
MAILERYKESATLWLAYLAVAPQWRGRGIATALISFSRDEVVRRSVPPPMPFLLSAAKHNDHDVVNPAWRHQLYRKIGFVPLAINFYDCGRLREQHASALAVYDPIVAAQDTPCDARYPASPIRRFIEDLYLGVLAEEGLQLTSEMEQYSSLAPGGRYAAEGIPMGHHYWTA